MAEVDLKRLPTHLTDEQIQLLNDSWVLIESNYELHGRQIFLTFFEDNPEYLEYFDFRAGFSENLKENKMLGAHVINVMNSIASLVKFGTKDDLLMFCSLTRIVQKHKHIKGKDVRGQDVQVKRLPLSVSYLDYL